MPELTKIIFFFTLCFELQRFKKENDLWQKFKSLEIKIQFFKIEN